METRLVQWLQGTPEGDEVEAILRSCVHCGFCTATCPTYQLLGDELDGPRGRIYLIKQVVEGQPATSTTQTHLDRCLTCRSCETTCPSGVRYGHLLDIGRELVERQVRRPAGERLARKLLREALTRPGVFGPALRVAQVLRPLLPRALREKTPPRRDPGPWPTPAGHRRKVLILNGCTQPAMMPGVDAATARVLDRLGIATVVDRRSGCCGAIRHHLGDEPGALADVQRNITVWLPWLDGQDGTAADAILINASGCGAMVKDYAHLLRNDPAWADKAQRVVAATRDLAEWLPERLEPLIPTLRSAAAALGPQRIAFHSPCTLQHGQQIRGCVEALLVELGVTPLPIADSHLCCGSAGSYSLLQPGLSQILRARKLEALGAGGPALILSANVGCIAHLQGGTATPVRHWIEWIDALLQRS